MSSRALYTRRIDGTALPERGLVGGKAWSLARMASLGLRVPPAFVITTDGYRAYNNHGGPPTGFADEVMAGVSYLEEATGRTFGSGPKALLLSVRSGAAVSMPGMMDTVLNLGITDDVQAALADESGDEQFARDTHMRFLDLFLDIVVGLDPHERRSNGVEGGEVSPADLRAIVEGERPDLEWHPTAQLMAAVDAVFRSWNSRRAKRYRAHQGIPDDLGTAVTVQAMVFGNLGEDSGTGVLFSRNPIDGSPDVFGEYLRRAQGEDVVSGRVTPEPLSDLAAQSPSLHSELLAAAKNLEQANHEVQDVEFTVQRGTLYLLQSRSAKLSPAAAVRTSIDLVDEGAVSVDQALARISPAQVRALLAPRLSEIDSDASLLASGESACSGVGVGRVVGDADEAVRLADAGVPVVLARPTTSPEDVAGMIAARAVITEEGGSTSHAAVVGRALGLPSVVGCGGGTVTTLLNRVVTVDGTGGVVYEGELPVVTPTEEDSAVLGTLLDWARDRSPISVTPTADGLDPATLLDLGSVPGGSDPDTVAEVIRSSGALALTGGAVACPEAVAAAVQNGVSRIVTQPVLPTLLAAVQAATSSTQTRPEGSAR